MLLRIDEHDSVLVEEAPVAFHQYRQIGAIPEGKPRPAVGKNVRIHPRGGIQRGSHALARIAVPRSFFFRDLYAGCLPELELRRMRAAAIAARDEWRLRAFDLAESLECILAAPDRGRIRLRPDQHEIVVHHLQPAHAMSLGYEFFLQRAR